MFSAKLHERVAALNTRVCLGIDPRPHLHAPNRPPGNGSGAGAVPTGGDVAAVTEYFTALLEATHDLIACCKPQSAFFEAMGLAGLAALRTVIATATELGVPVLLDAKRGDIDSTAEAYATAYLAKGDLAAGAMTVNGYLGMDSLEPFIDAAEGNGRGLFVLLKTSNPGSVDIQDLELAGGRKLYQHFADLLRARAESLARDARGYTALGVVVGATHASHLAELRAALPNSVMLVPGYGAQGGTPTNVASAFDAEGFGAVVSASRTLAYPLGSVEDGSTSLAAARTATVTMRDDINGALQ